MLMMRVASSLRGAAFWMSVFEMNSAFGSVSLAISAMASGDSRQFMRQGTAPIIEHPKIISRYSTQFLAAMQTRSPFSTPAFLSAEPQVHESV